MTLGENVATVNMINSPFGLFQNPMQTDTITCQIVQASDFVHHSQYFAFHREIVEFTFWKELALACILKFA